MLKLSYLTLPHFSQQSQSWRDTLLGVAAAGEDIDSEPAIPVAKIFTAALNAHDGLIEGWHVAGDLHSGQQGALRYRHSTRVLFGSIVLDEADFAGSGTNTGLHEATASAYRQIFELLDRLAFTSLWRVWNFIPQINVVTHGIERYRQFNSARQDAFLRSGRTTTGNVPAASALGTATGVLTIYFLAGRNEPLPIENPRQVSAYRYPREYGQKSPTFARGSLISLDRQELLFISGTASIVGHRTLHEGDVAAQTRELMINIEAVIAAANAVTKRHNFSAQELVYKVYIRRPADFSIVAAEMKKSLGIMPIAVYLQADICRADLLVEVEVSGGHLVEIS